MKLITVAAFNSGEEAEPVREYLCRAGLRAELRAESVLNHVGELSRPNAGVKLEVPRSEFEEALRLVYDWNVGHSGEGARVEWLGGGRHEVLREDGKAERPRSS